MELISKAKLYNEILKIENELLEATAELATPHDSYKFDIMQARLATCSMIKHLVFDFETEEQDLSVKYAEAVSALNDVNYAFKGYRQAIVESSCQSQRIDGVKIFTVNPLSFIDIEVSRWIEENKDRLKIIEVTGNDKQIRVVYSKIEVANEKAI